MKTQELNNYFDQIKDTLRKVKFLHGNQKEETALDRAIAISEKNIELLIKETIVENYGWLDVNVFKPKMGEIVQILSINDGVRTMHIGSHEKSFNGVKGEVFVEGTGDSARIINASFWQHRPKAI